MDEFNFIGKKVYIELSTGTKLDGCLSARMTSACT